MELQLGKQKRMMYARVFDRTEEETCSVDAVVFIILALVLPAGFWWFALGGALIAAGVWLLRC